MNSEHSKKKDTLAANKLYIVLLCFSLSLFLLPLNGQAQEIKASPVAKQLSENGTAADG